MTRQKSSNRISLIFLLLLIAGCANSPEEVDPFEPVNREIYDTNEFVDRNALGPIARGYAKLPNGMRRRVTNFFDNAGYLEVILNDLLQAKFKQGAQDSGRFLVNTTVGGLGLFDVATDWGLPAREEDFGQTLGVWGVEQGDYLMLPVLGPSSTRDIFSLPVDYSTDLLYLVGTGGLSLPLTALKVVDKRANLESTLALRDEAALDRYVFTREAYLQRREYLQYDGSPPESDPFEEFDDLLFDEPEMDEMSGNEADRLPSANGDEAENQWSSRE